MPPCALTDSPASGWAFRCAASRPAPRPGCIATASTSPSWSVQEGDEPIVPFSFETERGPATTRLVCHIAYTNDETHEVIRREHPPLARCTAGKIEGVGPRYCPSIEDKVVRFPDKPRHQIFVEPMGLDTEEMYLQGMSSSLPEDVQLALYRTIEGFEQVQIMRNAYAIEYDCVDPLAADSPPWNSQTVPGLYGAGQFNGTSGYEEAAAQGLVAGINAARRVQGQGAACPRPRPVLYRHPDRRPGHQGLLRPLPHDDLPLGIPPAAAPGQRRRSG